MSFSGLTLLAPGMAMSRSYRRVCAYCKGDPVNSACVNCGAPQAAEPAPILTTDRVLTAAQIAAVRRQWQAMYS